MTDNSQHQTTVASANSEDDVEISSASAEEFIIDNLDQTIARFSDECSFLQNAVDQEDSVIRSFAPPGLEEPFQQLHSILFPCLCRQKDEEFGTTASAILMGPRGSGKSLLLERCLAACQHQEPNTTFRKVVINGIVCRGEDVPSVVYEMIRQLSDMAYYETSKTENANNNSNQDDAGKEPESSPSPRKRPKQEDKYLLRLRKSTFTSNLALLESVFKIAEVDRIPILLVLDELDSFTDESERQLLLYHLLDRVATPGSNLCFIGITSSFTLLANLEKRIRSRAEGTTKIVNVRPPTSYSDMLEVLKHKLEDCHVSKDILNLMSPESGDERDEMSKRVWYTMDREFRFGKDLRWFSRVISSTLSLYRHDCTMSPKSSPKLKSDYLLDSLVMMGASISDDLTTSATKQPNLCLVKDQAVDPRLQALLDMSKPQVALLLSARRILIRESHREHVDAPLTIQRMLKEYESFRRGTKNSLSLLPAAMQLLERGLLAPSMDHSGGGPLQYHVSNIYKSLDPHSLVRLPLHMPVDIEREFGEALNQNLLDCPTALKEWGRKIIS